VDVVDEVYVAGVVDDVSGYVVVVTVVDVVDMSSWKLLLDVVAAVDVVVPQPHRSTTWTTSPQP
jgi:hypothetical protein